MVSTFVSFLGLGFGFFLVVAATARIVEPCVVTCDVSLTGPLHVCVGRPWQESVSATVVGVVEVGPSEAASEGEIVTAPLAVGTVVVSSGYVATSSHEIWWPTSEAESPRVWAVAPPIWLPSNNQRNPSKPKPNVGCWPAHAEKVAGWQVCVWPGCGEPVKVGALAAAAGAPAPIEPTLAAAFSVNHRLPSGPAEMVLGAEDTVVVGISVNALRCPGPTR